VPLPALLVCGFARAPGSGGSARCVSLCPPPSPGTSAGLSSATTPERLVGIPGCNSDLAPAAGETAARILSTDMGGIAAGVLVAFFVRHAPSGLAGLYNPREGPWEVKAPRSSCSGEDFAPLRGDSRHPVQRKLNTLPQAHPLWFSAFWGQLVRSPALASPLPALANHNSFDNIDPHAEHPWSARRQRTSARPCFFFRNQLASPFPARRPIQVQPDHAPARGCVLRLTAGTPLPSINGIVAPRGAGQMAPSLSATNT